MPHDDHAFLSWASQQFQQEDATPTASVDDCPSSDDLLDARLGRLAIERAHELIQHTLDCPLCAEIWRLADSSFIEELKGGEDFTESSPASAVACPDTGQAFDPQRTGGGASLSLREFKPDHQSNSDAPSDVESEASPAPAKNWIRWGWIGVTAAAAIALVVVLRPKAPESERILRGGPGSASQRLGEEHRFDQGSFRWPKQDNAHSYRLEVLEESLKPLFRVSNLTHAEYKATAEQLEALRSLKAFYWSVATIDKEGQSSASPTFRASMASPK